MHEQVLTDLIPNYHLLAGPLFRWNNFTQHNGTIFPFIVWIYLVRLTPSRHRTGTLAQLGEFQYKNPGFDISLTGNKYFAFSRTFRSPHTPTLYIMAQNMVVPLYSLAHARKWKDREGYSGSLQA